MSASRAIAANTLVQTFGRLVGSVLGVLTVAVMTRSLGASGYGAFTTATSFLQFFGILVDFGLTLTMTRMLATAKDRAEEDRIASNVFTLRLCSGLAFFGLAPVIALAFPYGADVQQAIVIGAVSFFAMASSQVLTGVFQKHMATGRAAFAEVAGRTVLFGGALYAANAGAPLSTFMVALVLGNLVQLAIALTGARKFAHIGLAFDIPMWKRITSESWPIGVSIAFNLVYLKGDVVIMSLSRTQAEVGLYGAAYKVLDVITVVPMIFMGLVLPLLATAWHARDKDEFGSKLSKAFDALSLMALPLAFGTFPVARDLMVLVAGSEFAGSGAALVVLMLAAAAVFWSALFGHAVVAIGLQKKMIAAYAADAALSLGLYFWAVPKFGGAGAAWVTVFSEVFIMICTAWAVLRVTGARLRLTVFLKALLASAVMALVVQGVSSLHVLLRVAVGMLAYTMLLFAFGAVSKETLRAFRRTAAHPDPIP
jgi:O-antigen/teichoic acid export membrane protein